MCVKCPQLRLLGPSFAETGGQNEKMGLKTGRKGEAEGKTKLFFSPLLVLMGVEFHPLATDLHYLHLQC